MTKAMQSGTPMGMLSQSNPQLKEVYDYIRSCGGDPKQAFYKYARENNAKTEPVLQQARSMLGLNK